ncbi:MAG TPA: sugar transferase, partial [Terriglobia bacterium]|nr:sugar transferase [Terriglobia bacterium]
MKRSLDLCMGLMGLIAGFPVLLALAVLIKLDSRGPVFYRGVRIGKGGRPFRIFKFRTMVVDADRIGGPSTSDDDPRVTRMGRFIRRHKLDELPQLLNVLAGEMSLVGPRPEVPQEVALYTAEERGLLQVLPGITDWASLRFHNEGEILKGAADPHQAYRERIRPEKMRLGLEYARAHSVWIDLKIILATVLTVAGLRGRELHSAASIVKYADYAQRHKSACATAPCHS